MTRGLVEVTIDLARARRKAQRDGVFTHSQLRKVSDLERELAGLQYVLTAEGKLVKTPPV